MCTRDSVDKELETIPKKQNRLLHNLARFISAEASFMSTNTFVS